MLAEGLSRRFKHQIFRSQTNSTTSGRFISGKLKVFGTLPGGLCQFMDVLPAWIRFAIPPIETKSTSLVRDDWMAKMAKETQSVIAMESHGEWSGNPQVHGARVSHCCCQ